MPQDSSMVFPTWAMRIQQQDFITRDVSPCLAGALNCIVTAMKVNFYIYLSCFATVVWKYNTGNLTVRVQN